MKTNIHVRLITALLLANNNIRIEDHSHDTRMIHCMCTRLKNNKKLPKSLCSFNMYVSAVLAERCSVGAKYPHLLSTAVVTEISLWTRTKPMCSCVWVCYWVCMFLCVLHCNLSGWSWNGFFFTWLPFLLMTEAVAWGEESHLTVCNVRECLRCDKSVPSAPSPDVCPNNHVFWSYWQICWISFSAVCLTHFHREPPQYDHCPLTGGLWGNASISWPGRKRNHWIPCVLHFQDIPSSQSFIIQSPTTG